jgi:site-specific recombinase XerD
MDLTDSWARSLRAAGRTHRTIDSYLEDVDYFTLQMSDVEPQRDGRRHELANELRMEHPVEDASRADVEEFLVWCRDTRGLADATVARRFRSLQQFFRWLDAENEIEVNPMERMKPPTVVDKPPPIISDDDMAKLMKACRGELADGGQRRRNNTGTKLVEFEIRRDTAMLTLLATTGVRASEIMGLDVTDINFDAETFTVLGKGNRIRSVAIVPEAVEAADRYLRTRRHHRLADDPALWIGRKGRMTTDGLRQILERRCADAGIDPINPHRFRHTFAHKAKMSGMTDENLMAVAGWQSSQMLGRYGRAATEQRAQAAHRKMYEGES